MNISRLWTKKLATLFLLPSTLFFAASLHECAQMDEVLSKFSNIAEGFHKQLKSMEEAKYGYHMYRRSVSSQLDDLKETIDNHGKWMSSFFR